MSVRDEAVTEQKNALRARFKEKAKHFFLSHDEAALKKIHMAIGSNADTYAAAHLTAPPKARIRVAVYEPMRFELPAQEILAGTDFFRTADFLYPVAKGDSMYFVDATGNKIEPEIIIVPGLFVDTGGNRLGRGKGYYDRYLSQSPLKRQSHIFLGYDFQVTDRVPVDEFDIRIGGIVTPSQATGTNP